MVFSFSATHAQINGNGVMITKTYNLDDIYKFESNFYADITLDMEEAPGITISAEENIIDYIGINTSNGRLNIDQKKWIEPSKRIKIIISAPNLRQVVMDTHDELKIVNMSCDIFKVEADIGKVILSGNVNDLRIKAKNGTIDASELKSKIASVKIKGDGRVTLNNSKILDCDINEDGRLININKEAGENDCNQKSKNNGDKYASAKYIDLKIKNNSWSRKHFVVVGPKPDGRSFSYGFPMMPGAVKNERWTVGTKIYKENSIGMRNLLVTLTEENEGQIVKLFD